MVNNRHISSSCLIFSEKICSVLLSKGWKRITMTSYGSMLLPSEFLKKVNLR